MSKDKTLAHTTHVLEASAANRTQEPIRPERTPVRTAEELVTLDQAEIVEGYMDGFGGDDEPGDNRSKSYWHGWRNGNSDRNHTPNLPSLALAHDLRRKGLLGDGVGRAPRPLAERGTENRRPSKPTEADHD